MKHVMDRSPAIPLIVNDPYFSVWMPADGPCGADASHWSGARQPISCVLEADGRRTCLLGRSTQRAELLSQQVTPTRTVFAEQAFGVEVKLMFLTPALPDDPDLLSVPVTFVSFEAKAADGKKHKIRIFLRLPDSLCYTGPTPPEMDCREFHSAKYRFAYLGQARQKPLSHSSDLITIDWGYLYAAGEAKVEASPSALTCVWEDALGSETHKTVFAVGYDDVASINYFGTHCKAWYARNGKTLPEAMAGMLDKYSAILKRCEKLDDTVTKKAQAIAGEDYKQIVSAAWRHTFAAHKLIATPEGEMALLSKENNSNGCIGTVDVSYPSCPIFLCFNPELVNALCRPVLKFASMPAWSADFAPHDVGRYPYATGQVYALNHPLRGGMSVPPIYALMSDDGLYNFRNQMPVEECGNMLIMLSAAVYFGADDGLARKYLKTLDTWVKYLDRYGEDPEEQLCTDDFAGHLAHNVNLSAKAIAGIACYANLLERLGRKAESEKWTKRARRMAAGWLKRAEGAKGTTLTFDGKGWSMKYNLVWDRVMKLGLLKDDFYDKETKSYLPRMNKYGLPLDSRADYTKSDWILWCAAMAPDCETKREIISPVAAYLRETRSRVAFSDWYDTKTGDYEHFIARSVQGGVFMPMLAEKAK